MLEILQQDYLRTAKAKGLGRFKVINKHALRNALIPIVTVIGMEIPMLFGGQVIVCLLSTSSEWGNVWFR